MTVKELSDVLNSSANLGMYEHDIIEHKYITRDILCLDDESDIAFIEMHGSNYIIENIETDENDGDFLYIYYRKKLLKKKKNKKRKKHD